MQITSSGYWRFAAVQRNPAFHCARVQLDDELIPQIQNVWEANKQVYGAEKVWWPLNREGGHVALCTVERLMKRLGLESIRRGKLVSTTIPDKSALCPLGLAKRQFKADRHSQLWVSDFTCVSIWQGWLYAAFVIACLPGGS